MNKNVFLFSGQGSQYAGMGKELVERFPQLKSIYDMASEIIGFDLAKKCWEGTDEELAQTIVAQPAIMATSLVAYDAAVLSDINCTAVAGHSLGEYAAMIASGILTMEDGFKVIKARAAAMQKAAENTKGAMCAIMGKTAEEIEEICSSIDGYVVPVNYNSNAQTVIAGEIDAIDKAAAKFSELGAKAIKLKVSAAFHSKLMQPAADEFKNAISDIEFFKPQIDFYSNLTGGMLTEFDNMPEKLAQHIVSPVKFTAELNSLFANGYTNYIELGPNKVLTGLVKKTLKGVNAMNIENEATLDKAIDALNK